MTRAKRIAGSGLAAWAALAGPLAAQTVVKDALKDLPTWKISDICAKDSAQNHCLALESRAWRTVSGSWVSLPDSVKKLCLGNARTPADYSWRVLNDCVDEEMEKAGDRRAVLTRATPAEPVPPPRAAPVAAPPPAVAVATPPPAAAPAAPTPAPAAPAPAAAPIPPPILGMPTMPPPFALDAEAMKRQADAAKAEADAKAKAEADAKARAEAEAKAKAEADAKARAEAEAKTKAEADAKARAEAEAKAKAEADAKARAEAEAKAKAEADAKARAEAEAKAKAEADAKARAAAAAVAKACSDNLQKIAKDGVIRFTFGSAALDSASSTTIEKLAASVKSCPGHVLRVEAHTDSVGSEQLNLDLSQRRAQAVVDALVKAGVTADLIKAEGFGETRPVADNATGEGRAQNRRIEFVVLPN